MEVQLCSDSQALIALACSLREFEQRKAAVAERLTRFDPAQAVTVTEEIIVASAAGDQRARKATLPLGLCIADLHEANDAPQKEFLAQAQQTDCEVATPIFVGGPARAQYPRRARLPEVGISTTAPVALSPLPGVISAAELRRGGWFRFDMRRRLRHEDPSYLRRVLTQDYVNEIDVVRVASRRPTTTGHLSVVRRSAWATFTRVRNALVSNPFTPGGVAAALLPTVDVSVIRHACVHGGEVLRPLAQSLIAIRRNMASESVVVTT